MGPSWHHGGDGAAFGVAALRRGTADPKAAAHASSVQAQAAGKAGSGRVVFVQADRQQEVDLEDATPASMERLMKEEAVQVLAAGAESTEKAPGVNTWYALMKPTRLGPFTTQMRLTCVMRFVPNGVHVDVVGFEIGTIKAGSKAMVFKCLDQETFSLQWENSLEWKPQGNGLHLIHSSSGNMRWVLPWWFPVPDGLVRITTEAGVQMMLRDGQTKIAAAIAARHAAWQ